MADSESRADSDGRQLLGHHLRGEEGSAVCAVCRRPIALTRVGQVRVHGPVGNRCPGSRSFPAVAAVPLPSIATSSDVRSSALPSESNPDFHQYSSAPIIKRVPKSSRHLAATKLSRILEDIVERNTEDAWSRLFKFPYRCLARLSRGGQRHSLATSVNRQLQEEADKPVPQLGRQRGRRATDDPLSDVRKCVSSKLEEGDFRGAVRIACSEDSIADINSVDTIRALSEKHPPRYDDSCVPQQSALFNSSSPSLNFSNVEVRAICSFPRGSAGGPDGLRPQHLLDLTSASAERGGVVLLSALASFMSHVVNGNTPDFIQPYFLVPV